MKKDMYDIMLNPTRMRIVQIAATRATMTANDICGIISDVPRTTLYRHINILIEANVLSVVDENKIRGSVERTLALNVAKLRKKNANEDIPQQALKFLMNIYAKFEKYFNNANCIHGINNVFFNNTIMMMTDQEFDQFLSDMQALFVKHRYEMADGRKPRDISIISSPPMEDNHEE